MPRSELSCALGPCQFTSVRLARWPPAWSWSGSEAAPPFESEFPKASASSCVRLPLSPQSLAGAFSRFFVLSSFIVFFLFGCSP